MCFEFVFIQQYAAKGGPEFFFVINMQVSIWSHIFKAKLHFWHPNFQKLAILVPNFSPFC
jgi:hypothetical protein